jgi:immune inhibitor A
MPPSPELKRRIVAARALVAAGVDLSAREEAPLTWWELAAILGRPARTRPDTFGVRRAPGATPVGGERRVVVLLVDFPDARARTDAAHYTDLLFSAGTHATGSMRDFYREASYGALDVTGDVAGWFRAPHPKAYYTAGNYGFGSQPHNAQQLVEDVLELADLQVDFSTFDDDGDGTIDALVVVCAGSGAEQTGKVDDIWSHKWEIAPQTRDGRSVSRFFMAPEDGRVGVMAHELGHLLMGWPDLYDTDYSSEGTGQWDLMAAGSWNGGGDTPAHPTAWCKVQAGWITPTTVWDGAVSVSLGPYANRPDAYRLPVGSADSTEYFLLSNRRRAGFDAGLPGEGLIVEHVDESRTSNTDESHYLVDVVQADGRRDLNRNANAGDATDPYPTPSNDTLTGTSTPSSDGYSGTPSHVTVTGIARVGDAVTADIAVGAAAVG